MFPWFAIFRFRFRLGRTLLYTWKCVPLLSSSFPAPCTLSYTIDIAATHPPSANSLITFFLCAVLCVSWAHTLFPFFPLVFPHIPLFIRASISHTYYYIYLFNCVDNISSPQYRHTYRKSHIDGLPLEHKRRRNATQHCLTMFFVYTITWVSGWDNFTISTLGRQNGSCGSR